MGLANVLWSQHFVLFDFVELQTINHTLVVSSEVLFQVTGLNFVSCFELDS